MDIETLLAPVDDAAPSGVDVRNDPRFHALERSLKPAAARARMKPDGGIEEGAALVDWDTVMSEAADLAAEGRDLRLLMIIVRGLANTEGYDGFVKGLSLLRDTVAEYWDSLHPALRENDEPRAAALPRINALKQLENDDNGLLGDLKLSPVLAPRGLGTVYGADLAAAVLSEFEMLSEAPSGLGQAEKSALSGRHAKRVTRVRQACLALADEEPDRLSALKSALDSCLGGLEALIGTVSDKAGLKNGTGLSFPELERFLTRVRKALEMAQADEPAAAAPASPDDAVPAASPPPAVAAPPAQGGSAIPAAITSRKDVERCLDMIIAFYERTEPSSPIPHLARRMRRMVPMDFLELMEEIAPSGMKEFRNVAGVADGKDK